MATVAVRSLSLETRRALKVRAAHHGRSVEAEILSILEEAVRPQEGVKLGSALAAFGRRFGGVDMDVAGDRVPVINPWQAEKD